MKKLSSKQQEIYDYIISFTKDHGYPPSVREIGSAVGLRSPSTVHTHLKSLKAMGYIRKDDRKTRAISVGVDAERETEGIPILGSVTAGQPIFAVEEDLGTLPITASRPGDYFALKVRGESMRGAGILDGDVVVVKKQQAADSGQIVVALLEDEATVKRLYRNKGEIWLMPENPDYEPIDGSECSILGVVKKVVRDL